MEEKIYIDTKQALYSIPRKVIATDRAKHYQDESPTAFEEEYKYTMEDENVCLDWLFNNTDAEDFHSHFKLEMKYPLQSLISDWGDDSVDYIGFRKPEDL